MSGVTGLVDTLVADKLAQRADLARLPNASVITSPAPAFAVRALENDVRLQSDAPQHTPPGSSPPAAPVAAREAALQGLSSAGQAIKVLLADLGQAAEPLPGAAPIAGHPGATSTQLAQGLEQALGRSGLFYESHLAALASGALAPQDLAWEPQSALARVPAGAAQADHQGRAAAPDVAARADAGPAAVIHPAARSLVSHQLDLLATGAFHWRGEAWPGVPMRWSVQEQPRDGADDESAERTWRTSATLQMPRLGEVEVRLSISGASVAVALIAEAQAANELRSGSGALAEALGGAGLASRELAVRVRGAP